MVRLGHLDGCEGRADVLRPGKAERDQVGACLGDRLHCRIEPRLVILAKRPEMEVGDHPDPYTGQGRRNGTRRWLDRQGARV